MAEVFDGKALRVILCGTSSPLPDPNRAKACTIVVAGDKAYVIDTGPESWEQLPRMQFPGTRIAGDFHHALPLRPYRRPRRIPHADHGRRPQCRCCRSMGPRREAARRRLQPGLRGRRAPASRAPWRRVINLATSPLVAKEFGAAFKGELRPKKSSSQDGDLKVTAFEVDHDPIRPAVGYRFDWKGRSVVLSGDTALSANLVENAKGADVLVSESLAPNLIGMVQQQQ